MDTETLIQHWSILKWSLSKGDEYHSATAKTTEEAKKLVESGFEFICTTPENVMLFRERK